MPNCVRLDRETPPHKSQIATVTPTATPSPALSRGSLPGCSKVPPQTASVKSRTPAEFALPSSSRLPLASATLNRGSLPGCSKVPPQTPSVKSRTPAEFALPSSSRSPLASSFPSTSACHRYQVASTPPFPTSKTSHLQTFNLNTQPVSVAGPSSQLYSSSHTTSRSRPHQSLHLPRSLSVPSRMVKREPIILNVYDMLWTNKYTSPIGLGVFHSGVQVYGREYAFGGHSNHESGIFNIRPKDEMDLGYNFRFRQSIKIGYTRLSRAEVQYLVMQLGRKFRGNRYHLVNNNCNHFTAYFTEILCGRRIPRWINRLANVTGRVPFLKRCLPKEWLTPDALEHDTNADRQSNKEKSYQ